MPKRLALLVPTIAIVLVATACGSGDDGGAVARSDRPSGSDARTVEVSMVDVAFEPTTLTVEDGETIRFVFRNDGKVAHDAFLGDDAAQKAHETEMSSMGGEGMDHGGDATTAVTVEPGKTAEITHTFRAGDELLVGCHQPGHYAAGMELAIDVA